MCRDQNLISGDEPDLLSLSERMKIEKPGVGRPLLGLAKIPTSTCPAINDVFGIYRKMFVNKLWGVALF